MYYLNNIQCCSTEVLYYQWKVSAVCRAATHNPHEAAPLPGPSHQAWKCFCKTHSFQAQSSDVTLVSQSQLQAIVCLTALLLDIAFNKLTNANYFKHNCDTNVTSPQTYIATCNMYFSCAKIVKFENFPSKLIIFFSKKYFDQKFLPIWQTW